MALLAAVAVLGCKESARREAQAPRAIPAPQSQTAGKVIAEPAEEDPAWLTGTWKKEGEPRWFLFNPPAEAAELAGNPARVVRRGKLIVRSRFVDVLFGVNEVHLEATRDRSELRGDGVYRRGAPP
jgi:hypothetical protein